MSEKIKIEIKQPKKEKEIDWERLEQKLSEGILSEVGKVVVEMFKLAQKLNERAYLYDSIISDDASGRLVSLFLKKVLDVERERKGIKPLKLRFIATGRHDISEIQEKIKEYLNKNKDELGKVLLVTEFVSSGDSIKKIIAILDELNISFSVAALTISNPDIEEKIKSEKSGEWKLYYGDVSKQGVILHDKPHITGVEKRIYTGNILPFPEKVAGYGPFSAEKRREVQWSIWQAREDVKLLAERVSELLSRKNNEPKA